MRRPVALWISIGFNIVLLVVASGVTWLGWLERGSGRIGVLSREVCAVSKDPSFPARFCLPKGLSVRDVASRGLGGIGQFEPNRYSVVISTDSEDLVSFDVPKAELNRYEDLYSVHAAGWVK